MVFSYWTFILFIHSSVLVIYSCYTRNTLLLVIGSYVVSEIADSVTPLLKLKCPLWYGLDGIENARQKGVTSDWSTWQCAITVSSQALLSSLNGGSNILAANFLIIENNNKMFNSASDLRGILNFILSKYNNGSYHEALEDIYSLSIMLLALLSFVSDKFRKTYTKHVIMIMLMTKLLLVLSTVKFE